MCVPLAVAGLIASVAGSAVGIIQQSKAANAQAKAIANQQAVVNEENRKAASAELFDQARATRREQAKIKTAAGEAGLSLTSGSIEGLLMDSAMQMELQGSRTIANMESKEQSNNAEAESMQSQISRPSILGAGLQLAGTTSSGFAAIGNAKIARAAASKV